MYTDDVRADAAEWLADNGWRVDSVPSADEMTRLGRPATDDLVEEAIDSVFVHARLEGETR
jgi:O-methyltransferase involved in polyketide biosynthesis